VIDAVIRTGGKQYRVHEGSVLRVATMAAEPGSRVELRDVLLVSNDGNVTVGTPVVDGAVVVAEVVEHGRGKKVVNFKYKAKVRYRRKQGHRQGFTTLSVREITANGVTVTAPERPERPEPEPAAPAMDMSARPAGFAGRVEAEAPAEEPLAQAPAEEPVAGTEAEAPAAEEAPAPRTRRRRAAASEPAEEDKDE
jgi:large subunit ribosomal protein L21